MVKYPDSVTKIFDYFTRILDYPVMLSPRFFRKLVCPAGCGACCRFRFTMDWFDGVREDLFPSAALLEQFGTHLTERTVSYAGNSMYRSAKSIKVYSVLPGDDMRQCVFLADDGRCGIHDVKPLSCRVEPIKFWLAGHGDDRYIRIEKRKYGRGHMFTRIDGQKGAMCEFSEYDEEEYEADLDTLDYLVAVAEKLDLHLLPIYLLIDFMRSNMDEILSGGIKEVVKL